MESEAARLAVVTPSYRRDFPLCRDLNRSVIRWMPSIVQHHIIVPRKDLAIFRTLANPRTVIHCADEYLPPHVVKVPLVNVWLNLARPWPPLRGWITQQLVKLSVAASLQVDAVLLVDSDMVFVAECDLRTFAPDGQPPMYRNPGAVHRGMPQHRIWLETAHDLLALGPVDSGNLTDYICWPCLWEPATVRSLLGRIGDVSGVSWQTAVGSRLHFSEMMLYGTYVDKVLGGPKESTSAMRSICYSDEAPLTLAELELVLREGPDDAVAVMISAKAGISGEVRKKALERYSATRRTK